MKALAIQVKKTKNFESKTGLRFRKKALLLAALTHPSCRDKRVQKKLLSFERLEFLGDSILNLIVSERLFRLFPEQNEGFLSQLRASLVSRKALARIARKLSLGRFLLLGGDWRNMDQGKEKILADSFEALIAAVYFDRGLGKTRTFLLKFLEPSMNRSYLNRSGHNPKGMLQEWAQQKHKILPCYQTDFKDDRAVVTVKVGRFGKATAEGPNKKEAQEKAARELLKILKRK